MWHGVEGWVRQRAHAAKIPVPELDVAVHGALARHQRALGDLTMATRALGDAGVQWLVVKGPVLAEHFYPAPELRSYVDLDLLVAPTDLAASVEALEGAGCQLLDANWPLLLAAPTHELKFLGPTGGVIDLHWSLGKGEWRADSSPPVSALLDRSQQIAIRGIDVRTLDLLDTAVYVSVHAAGTGGDRLIWCADLRAVLGGTPSPTDLRGLVERAHEWRATPATHLMLAKTQSSLGVPIADVVLAGLLKPGPWSGLTSSVERRWPTAQADGGRSFARLTSRSARGSSRESWLALARKSLAAAAHPRRPAQPEWLVDPDDPRSASYEAGGPPARDQFFATVADRAAIRAAGRDAAQS